MLNSLEKNKLLKIFYIYPPLIIIINIYTYYLNNSDYIPEYLKIFFSKLNNDKTSTSQKARTNKLIETNYNVLKFGVFTILICYLFIRYFINYFKEQLKLKNLKCSLNPKFKDSIINKKLNIKEKENKCNKFNSNINLLYNKCTYCINFLDNDLGENICQINDINQNSPIIFNKLDDNCKYYNEDIEINNNEYLYDNINIFLVLLFIISITLLKYIKNIVYCSIITILPAIISIIIFLIIKNKEKYIFNLIILIIIIIINLINLLFYNKLFN